MVRHSYFLLALTGTALVSIPAHAMLGRHVTPMMVRPSVETHLEILSTLQGSGEILSDARMPTAIGGLEAEKIVEPVQMASLEPADLHAIISRPAEPQAIAATMPETPALTQKTAEAAPAPVPTQTASLLPMAASSSVAVSDASSAAAAGSATPGVPVGNVGHGVVEAGINYHDVSDNLGNWFGQYLKGEYQLTERNRLSGEVVHQREFRDDGNYFALGDTFIINDDWYASLSGATSTDGFFYPRYRVDAFLYRKWLPEKRLVTSIGLGEYKARQVYKDRSVSLGVTYYFAAPWIAEAGVRFNTSDPGSVDSTSAFAAVTQGEDKKHFVTVRYGFGDESYQIIAPGSPISDFSSNEISVTWRQWLADDWGFNLRGERYHNPNYDRTGINLGIFKEF